MSTVKMGERKKTGHDFHDKQTVENVENMWYYKKILTSKIEE